MFGATVQPLLGWLWLVQVTSTRNHVFFPVRFTGVPVNCSIHPLPSLATATIDVSHFFVQESSPVAENPPCSPGVAATTCTPSMLCPAIGYLYPSVSNFFGNRHRRTKRFWLAHSISSTFFCMTLSRLTGPASVSRIPPFVQACWEARLNHV